MATAPSGPPGPGAGETDLTATYLKVIAVELLVIAALYWLSVAFV